MEPAIMLTLMMMVMVFTTSLTPSRLIQLNPLIPMGTELEITLTLMMMATMSLMPMMPSRLMQLNL